MEKKTLKPWVRLLLILCSAALVVVLFVPMWRIDLAAPQYPEGLGLLIYPDRIGGDVDIINGLNHYIGMKTLHTEDFMEFRILPVIIGVFAAAFLLVALINRLKWMNILLICFVLFGIIAMVDFWRWEYNYGHNLDPNAAIIVPGMAYQPPLIGFKQLLNFGAYSIPDTGGWLFIGVGMVLLGCVLTSQKTFLNRFFKRKNAVQVMLLAGFTGLLSCNMKVDPIRYGKDNCQYCKMTISDKKFGTAILTEKGKTFKFDDIVCMSNYTKQESGIRSGATFYVAGFTGTNALIPIGEVYLLKSDQFKSPMGGNIAAFKSREELESYRSKSGGEIIEWQSLLK